MGKINRIFKSLSSLLMIGIGIIIILLPFEISYIIVSIIIGLVIMFRSIKGLIFYFASARNMIGGKRILVNNIILFDLGALSFFALLKTATLGMLYLVGMFMMFAVIDILRAVEIKKNGGRQWIFKIIQALTSLGLGVFCIIFINSQIIMSILFGIAWIIKGVGGLIKAFRKASIEYIPIDKM